MECAKCLEEVKHLIETVGYGYSYIGTAYNCHRHDKKSVNDAPHNFKWTDGQPYERSRKIKDQMRMEAEQISKEVESSAYSSALNHDENTWDILNQSLSGAGFKVSNKREELGNKLASRDMIHQIGVNPFLGQTNYVDDISIRDQFLKPINTTQDEI